jgi:uncharacterized RDD family membrane protein YckC
MELVIRRVIANVIDHLIIAIPTFVIGVVLFVFAVLFRVLFWFLPWNLMFDKPFWFFTGSVSLLYIAYESISLYSMKTTIGKKIMNLEVRALDSTLDGWTCLLRSTLKEIFFGPLLFPVGLLSLFYIIVSDNHSSFHDIAAKTRIW